MVSRRKFINAGVATGIAFSPVLRSDLFSNVPSDTINVAVVGIRSRGGAHIENFSKLPNVRVAAICDVDERLFPEALKNLQKLGNEKVRTETDVRRLLDSKDIDVISIATPDHWHAPATIWACQANKDVYVEKPISHNIWEGEKMIEAAKKYNRIVQAGFQNRSNSAIQAAIKFLHEGGIGNVYMAKGLCFKNRDTIGKKPDSPVPQGVHYDLWLGPAPKRPFNENRFHYNWHWFWDYGCADIGNQGPHQMDIARWGLNKEEFPHTIKCVGGHLAFDDDQETPNVQHATLEYKDGKVLQFEVRGLYTNAEADMKIGNFFYGTKGWMIISNDKKEWKTFMGRNNEPGPSMTFKEGADANNLAGSGDGPHFVNFIEAVRARDPKKLAADIECGHKSTALSHLCNISYRLKREVKFDPNKKKFDGDSEANNLLSRSYRQPFTISKNV
jgi:predicted dehydrogenase